MIEIELQSHEEFEKLNLPGAGTIVAQLEKKYPKIFKDTITEIKERYDVIDVKYDNIFDLVTWAELIEYIDENIEEEILINYYVKGSCGTDRGTQYLLVANGYRFKEDEEVEA